MNNPNPFVPKGSLLEQQSQRRSRLKLAVFCVLAVSITGLVAMLIQGCKRESPDANAQAPVADTNTPPLDMGTNTPPPIDTNVPPAAAAPMTNTAMMQPPTAPPPTMPAEVQTPAAASTYEVVAGDTLAKIAKKNGVSLKALQAANPGVDPRKLHAKQKLNIPASTKSPEAASVSPAGAPAAGAGENYTVKSGDTLTKIAKRHGVSLKALRAANSLSTDHIKVGQQLVIPGKTETNTASAPAAEAQSMPAVPPPVVTPASTSTPAAAPGH